MSALSSKTKTILTMIANGHTYDQILARHRDFTYRDIFGAAEEALARAKDNVERLEKIKNQFPNAYTPWTEEDDQALTAMHGVGTDIKVIAKHFQRQPSAIRSRLDKLGLESHTG